MGSSKPAGREIKLYFPKAVVLKVCPIRPITSPENLLEKQIIGPTPLLWKQLLEMGSVICALTSPSGDSDAP
jgi:hypothetical protein